ncbi:MAG TPA: type II toxin-antitoxin system RelE/ParE family toxin [Gammaproteobacteria bacterium]|nr:type II toxin-antitoxin system RelE/ParE family toxin [Gammaproteobacteria bacterium]
MHIKWLDFARTDLDSIEEYVAMENPDAAVRVVLRRGITTVEILADQPGVGRLGRVEGTRELVLTDIPYTVTYRIKNKTIEVLRVLHQAMK